MAAHDSLSPDQFYHGTNAELAPGDMVQPNYPKHDDPVWANHGHSDFVWSSPLPREASVYGDNVYEVEHTGLTGLYKHNTPISQAHVSLAPMRVIRKVSNG